MKIEQIFPSQLLYFTNGEINGSRKFRILTFIADQKVREISGDSIYQFRITSKGPVSDDLAEAIRKTEDIKTETSTSIGGHTRTDYRLLRNDVPENEPTFTASKITAETYDIPVSNLVDTFHDEYPRFREESNLDRF